MNFVKNTIWQTNRKPPGEPSNPPRDDTPNGIERVRAACRRGWFRFSPAVQIAVATDRRNSGIAVDPWIDVSVQGGVETSQGVLAVHAF